MIRLDAFTRQYLITALWASTDDSDRPMDERYGIEDLAPECVAQAKADCERFQKENAQLLEGVDPEDAGHDFWLTRNGHGAGFWDGDYPETIGEALTEACEAYGSCDLYVGDDGKVYAA